MSKGMKAVIQFEEENEFRQYAKSLVEGAVKSVVRQEIKAVLEQAAFEKVSNTQIPKVLTDIARSMIRDQLTRIDVRALIRDAINTEIATRYKWADNVSVAITAKV